MIFDISERGYVLVGTTFSDRCIVSSPRQADLIPSCNALSERRTFRLFGMRWCSSAGKPEYPHITSSAQLFNLSALVVTDDVHVREGWHLQKLQAFSSFLYVMPGISTDHMLILHDTHPKSGRFVTSEETEAGGTIKFSRGETVVADNSSWEDVPTPPLSPQHNNVPPPPPVFQFLQIHVPEQVVYIPYCSAAVFRYGLDKFTIEPVHCAETYNSFEEYQMFIDIKDIVVCNNEIVLERNARKKKGGKRRRPILQGIRYCYLDDKHCLLHLLRLGPKSDYRSWVICVVNNKSESSSI